MSNINLGPVINAVNQVGVAVSSLEGRVSAIDNRVGVVAKDVASTAKELRELREEFLEFVRVAERTANVQRSETKLGSLKDDLDREYGHYSVVRRSSIGTLQAFDVGNVTNKTVQQVSEELMIQTPRYWLAPALVALAAWSRDDESLASKSVDEAFTRDARKTGLFFALVLRRQGRLEAASRWLRQYFISLDPRALTRDFAVVLEAAAQEGFGPTGREVVLEHLGDWSETLRNDDAVVAAQVEKWLAEVSVHRGVVDESVYPRLVETAAAWPQIKDVMEHASAHGNVVAKYEPILDTVAVTSGTLEDQMDALLETLVTEYDAEELPLRREIIYHEAVLESNGDLARAREAADAAVQALDETMDALSLVANAALHPDLLGVSPSTQKLAIGASKGDFSAAVGRYSAAYRARHLGAVDITLGPTHTGYAATLGFGTWTSSTATLEADAQRSLSEAWDATLRDYVERHRLKNSVFVIGGLVTLGVIALFALVGGWIGALIALVLAGGISALVIWRKKKRADDAVALAEADREAAKAASIEVFREATAEFVDAQLAYADEDAREAELIALVAKWPAFDFQEAGRAELGR